MVKVVDFRRSHEGEMVAGVFTESKQNSQAEPEIVCGQVRVQEEKSEEWWEQISGELFDGMAVDC